MVNPQGLVTEFSLIGAAVLLAALVVVGLLVLRSRHGAASVTVIESEAHVPREQWTMPPLALLARPVQSTGRKAAMLSMEVYLLLAVSLLIVKAVQLAGG